MSHTYSVVVTWNGQDYIRACLQSLRRSTVPVSIIVVDNASSDGTRDIVREACSEATLIRLRHNLGFGRANNIGIKHAYDWGAEHVLLLNQDAYVKPDTVGGLIELMQTHSDYGILSPLHLDGSEECLDRRFGLHLAKSSGISQLLSDQLLSKQQASIYDVEFVNAAIWLLSRECIERVGLFNPAFEQYGEDREYADRVRFQGLRVGVVPALCGVHDRKQDRSEDNASLERYFLKEKSIIRYRLSRKTPGIAFNLLSALSRVVFSRPPGVGSFLRRIGARLVLLYAFFVSVPTVLRTRAVAYGGQRCFFEAAKEDRIRYLSQRE